MQVPQTWRRCRSPVYSPRPEMRWSASSVAGAGSGEWHHGGGMASRRGNGITGEWHHGEMASRGNGINLLCTQGIGILTTFMDDILEAKCRDLERALTRIHLLSSQDALLICSEMRRSLGGSCRCQSSSSSHTEKLGLDCGRGMQGQDGDVGQRPSRPSKIDVCSPCRGLAEGYAYISAIGWRQTTIHTHWCGPSIMTTPLFRPYMPLLGASWQQWNPCTQL